MFSHCTAATRFFFNTDKKKGRNCLFLPFCNAPVPGYNGRECLLFFGYFTFFLDGVVDQVVVKPDET